MPKYRFFRNHHCIICDAHSRFPMQPKYYCVFLAASDWHALVISNNFYQLFCSYLFLLTFFALLIEFILRLPLLFDIYLRDVSLSFHSCFLSLNSFSTSHPHLLIYILHGEICVLCRQRTPRRKLGVREDKYDDIVRHENWRDSLPCVREKREGDSGNTRCREPGGWLNLKQFAVTIRRGRGSGSRG